MAIVVDAEEVDRPRLTWPGAGQSQPLDAEEPVDQARFPDVGPAYEADLRQLRSRQLAQRPKTADENGVSYLHPLSKISAGYENFDS
jgi:hypothetical protein